MATSRAVEAQEMRKTIYIGNTEYTREVLLIENRLLQELQRVALQDQSSLSEAVNKVLSKALQQR